LVSLRNSNLGVFKPLSKIQQLHIIYVCPFPYCTSPLDYWYTHESLDDRDVSLGNFITVRTS
jgi:hypothetical protein